MKRKDIEKTIFDARPKLQEVLDTYGNDSYLSYLKEKTVRSSVARDDIADALFLQACDTLMRRFFDARMVSEIKEEIKKHFFASTADHGGIVCHPFFSDTFLARALDTSAKNRELVLTLPCSGISLDNSSYARGLVFHDNNLKEVRLHLKSLGEQHHSVYALSPYTKQDIERVLTKVDTLHLTKLQRRTLKRIISEVFDRDDQYSLRTYDEQMVRANWLMPKYIKGFEHIEHVSLSQEMLARELILLHLETDSLVSRLLIDSEMQSEYEKHFDGTTGAHSTTAQKGTFLFWGVRDNIRIQLFRKNDGWYDEQGNLFLSLDKDAIREALLSWKIYPSMALTFFMLTFLHKLTTGGGFSQINYLGDIQRAFESFIQSPTSDSTTYPPTDIFTADIIVNTLAHGSERVPATLLDVILYQDETTHLVMKEAFTHTTLHDAVLGMMPEYYKIVTGQKVDSDTLADFPIPKATLHVRKETE